MVALIDRLIPIAALLIKNSTATNVAIATVFKIKSFAFRETW
jgi:hypothetical protein